MLSENKHGPASPKDSPEEADETIDTQPLELDRDQAPTPQSLGIDLAHIWDSPHDSGRKVPESLLHALIRKGLTNKQAVDFIQTYLGVNYTGAAVHYFRRKHGYDVRSPTSAALALIPWKVAVEHNHDLLYHFLIHEARLRSGTKLSKRARYSRDAMVRRIASTGDGTGVIHYDRSNGFRLVTRRPGIDTDLIREPGIDDFGNPIEGWRPRS